MTLTAIEWLEPDAFAAIFAATYRHRGVFLEQEVSAAIGVDDVAVEIGSAGDKNPSDAGDEPGPIVRWYGRAGNTLFYITAYQWKQLSILATRRSVTGFSWSALRDLKELRWWWSNVTWIRSFAEIPTEAACRIDRWGILRQVYECESSHEADAVAGFLNEASGSGSDFFRCEVDRSPGPWEIYEGTAEGSPRGRYTRRESAEEVARGFSESSSNEFRVVEASSGQVRARFLAGRAVR